MTVGEIHARILKTERILWPIGRLVTWRRRRWLKSTMPRTYAYLEALSRREVA